MGEKNKIQTRTPLRCFICKMQPESAFGDHVNDSAARVPYAATIFKAHGHYGSTAFDPLDASFLEINICDDCLMGESDDPTVVVVGRVDPRPASVTYVKWDNAGLVAERDG